MITYWILLSIAIVIESRFLYNSKKINKTITNELINSKKPQIIMWKITKYKEEELDLLLSNPDVIDLLVRIFEYKVAIKTDSIRSLEATERKVWYLDCLHENRLFFLKLKNDLEKKKEKIWQELV